MAIKADHKISDLQGPLVRRGCLKKFQDDFITRFMSPHLRSRSLLFVDLSRANYLLRLFGNLCSIQAYLCTTLPTDTPSDQKPEAPSGFG